MLYDRQHNSIILGAHKFGSQKHSCTSCLIFKSLPLWWCSLDTVLYIVHSQVYAVLRPLIRFISHVYYRLNNLETDVCTFNKLMVLQGNNHQEVTGTAHDSLFWENETSSIWLHRTLTCEKNWISIYTCEAQKAASLAMMFFRLSIFK